MVNYKQRDTQPEYLKHVYICFATIVGAIFKAINGFLVGWENFESALIIKYLAKFLCAKS